MTRLEHLILVQSFTTPHVKRPLYSILEWQHGPLEARSVTIFKRDSFTSEEKKKCVVIFTRIGAFGHVAQGIP